MNKKILKSLSILIFLCFVYCGVIYFFQDKFLFHPDKNYKSPQEANTPQFIEMPVISDDGTEIMCWYFKGLKEKPLILFFHGNTGQIARFAPAMTAFTKFGYSVAMMEYRGFGNTKGKISQEKVFSDAVNFYDHFKTKTENKIIFYGYSFGCAVAAGLTQYRNADEIILTAPFISFVREVKDKLVPFAYLMLKDKYPSDKYIKNIKNPVLFIHGKNDMLIKSRHSQELFDLAPVKEKEIVIVDGVDHHDIFFKEKNIPYIITFINKMLPVDYGSTTSLENAD